MSKILEQLNAVQEASANQNATSKAPETKLPQNVTQSNRRTIFLAFLILIFGTVALTRLYKKHFKKKTVPTVQVDPLIAELGRSHADALQAIEQKNFDRAVTSFESIVSKAPEKVEPLINLAFALKKKGDLKRAEETLLKALEQEPKNALALNNLGLVYFEEKQFEQAVASLGDAVKHDPSASDSVLNLAFVYEKEKKWTDAIASYERYLKFENARKELRALISERIRRLHSYSVTVAVGGTNVQ